MSGGVIQRFSRAKDERETRFGRGRGCLRIGDALVHFPERMSPSKSAEQAFSVRVEASDVEGSSQGFDAVEPPWLAVVDGIGRNKVRYWTRAQRVSA